MKIGFLGLGQMGAAMAANLLKAGHDLTVYNRSPGKADALVAAGAREAKTIAEACGGEVVFSMLADDAAAEAVALGAGGVRDSLAHGAIHVSASTIGVEQSRRLAAAHQQAGQFYVSAPVFGRPEAAEAAQLVVLSAGPKEARERCAPLFEAIGRLTFDVSDTAEAANVAKLGGNFLIASAIGALGETLAMAERAGIDRHAYLDLLTSTLFAAPVYKTYGAIIADRAYSPARFGAPLGAKDLRLVLAAASELDVDTPIARLIHERYLELLAKGGETLDWAALGSLPLGALPAGQ